MTKCMAKTTRDLVPNPLDPTALAELAKRLREGKGPDRDVDRLMHATFALPAEEAPLYTTYVDVSADLAEAILPPIAWNVVKGPNGRGVSTGSASILDDDGYLATNVQAATPALAMALALVTAVTPARRRGR